MAYSLFAQNGKPAYGVKNYVLDNTSDIQNLTIADTPGSTAFVVATGETYILNNNREWVIMPSSGKNGESSSTIIEEYESIPLSEIDSYFND